MNRDGMLTLLQSYDQRRFLNQPKTCWAAEEEIAPPTTIERNVKFILYGNGLSTHGLELAYEVLDGCQNEASIKPAAGASKLSSGGPCDAAIPQFRKPDVVNRHRSTCRADIIAESVSGSSGEALERMAIPACTQHEDAGERALSKPVTCALEKVLSDALPHKSFTPVGSERREIFDAVRMSSDRMPFTGPAITSNLSQARPASRLGVHLDRPADHSDPPVSITSCLAEPTACATLPTIEPHINTDSRTSSDFFPKSLSFAKNLSQRY
jgi:hypothetical protein